MISVIWNYIDLLLIKMANSPIIKKRPKKIAFNTFLFKQRRYVEYLTFLPLRSFFRLLSCNRIQYFFKLLICKCSDVL